MRGLLQNLEQARSLWSLAGGRLRARLLAARGARIGAKVAVGPRCMFDRPWGLELGERVLLEPEVFVKLVEDAATLTLADHVFVGRGVEFDVMSGVSVGRHSLIAPRCFITDHVHGIRPELRIDQQPCRAAPVEIGADVWLGAGVVVLPGVKIGDGAVVGASSVVTADVAPYAVVAGAPARFLRQRAGQNDDIDAAIR
jgi:acetyltransferase-like isoleucine patch superfamily enzyme